MFFKYNPNMSPTRRPERPPEDPLNPKPLEGQNSPENGEEMTLRPSSLADYVGQQRLKENLKISIEAAKLRKEPLDHILFCGPPGLGKTTLSHIIAHEMGVSIHSPSGPAIE